MPNPNPQRYDAGLDELELIALDDGHRESTESCLDVLRGCKRRGMATPVLAVGDGALGFWSAVREVFPETREQRCWWHHADFRIIADQPALSNWDGAEKIGIISGAHGEQLHRPDGRGPASK